jgi:uncharacterized LabA/DUF88 family protein
VTDSARLRIAVFIDFDNIEIGVKNTLGAQFDAGLVLDALKERGEVVSKTAYSDWQRAGGYSRMLTQHAIRMVQRNMTPGGDKNGADINLALDALEMAFTHSHINAFVIVGGDSDFISLVEKLKQYDKKVFIVGGRQFTSQIMQKNCHEFIAYENLVAATGASVATASGTRRQSGRDRAPVEQAIPLVTRALKVLSEREVSPQLGLLKSTLLQLDSTFSERSYGAGSFRDFVQKLEKVGLVKVHHGRGGLLVELADGAPAPVEKPAAAEEAEAPTTAAEDTTVAAGDGEAAAARTSAPPVIGTAADGLRELRRILATAVVRRWPMYLRNVKQVLRQADASFDERAYGFANLTDLLRAAHREGVVRVDRDRQGVIRVFQGTAAARVADEAAPSEASAEETGDTSVDEVAVAASAIGVPLLPVDTLEEQAPDDGADASADAGEAAAEASSPAEGPATGARRGRRRARRPASSGTATRTRRSRKAS